MAILMFLMSCILGLAFGTMITRWVRAHREARKATRNA